MFHLHHQSRPSIEKKRAKLRGLFIAAIIPLSLISSCRQQGVSEPKSQPPALTVYTPRTDGEWLNIEDVMRTSKSSSSTFTRYRDWIFEKYFGVARMRNTAFALRPPTRIVKTADSEEGMNPSITYSCSERKFFFSFGKTFNDIIGKTESEAYFVFRINRKVHWAEKSWQPPGKRNVEGVNVATGKVEGKFKETPNHYTLSAEDDFLGNLESKSKENPLSGMITAKSFEISVMNDKSGSKRGAYAKWEFDKTLKEQKDGGDLDSACKLLLGADYITVEAVQKPGKK